MKTQLRRAFGSRKMILAVLAVVVVAGAGAFFWQDGRKAAATPHQTVRAELADIASVVAASGTITPVNMVDISSKITAQIKEVKVRENDQVKAGQVLVILEDTGLQAQVTQVRERLENAAVKQQRAGRMHRIGAASKEQLDDATMEYNIARASYDQTMSNLNETVITAPIDGTVIGQPLSAGEMVAQGVSNPTVILTVADMSRMQIEAQVDQTDIGKVANGQKVRFTVDAYPGKQFAGVVSNISRKPVVQQNVTYYPVTVDVTDAENMLNPGMVARVSVITEEKKGIVTLPPAAVQSDKTGKFAVVAGPDGQTRNIRITTGSMNEDRVEIVSGLSEGDQVVLPQSKAQPKAGTGQPGNPMNIMRRN